MELHALNHRFSISTKGVFLSLILVTSLFSALNLENADGAEEETDDIFKELDELLDDFSQSDFEEEENPFEEESEEFEQVEKAEEVEKDVVEKAEEVEKDVVEKAEEVEKDVVEKAVAVNSVGFEKTTIIEFENSGTTEIETFRLWLGSDISFKSFKTEKGWTGTKSSVGVLIFTPTTPLKSGESVKFGIKTDKEKPGINWKALDKKDEQIETGKTLVTDQLTTFTQGPGVLSDSTFRLIPEKPNVGSTVRVTGEKFGANQELDFYMDGKKLDSFETDNSGFFIFTSKIPNDKKADRVEFAVKDSEGKEKTFSIRINIPDEVRINEEIPLSIDNLPSVIYRGDVLLITGTGNPGGTITATISGPEGDVTTSAADIGTDGKWSYETLVAVDTPFGKYSATISDGNEIILRNWVVETSQKIQIVPASLKFEPGELMKFNGTAIANENLEIIIENPQGLEIFSEIFEVNSSGFVNIEFPTSFSDIEGTYVLFAFQEENTAIVLVGLGELPEANLVAKMDKLNYKAGDMANLALDGPPSSTISMIIVDPSDKTEFTDTIILGPDGKKNYELDLTGYSSGVYTIVISRGNSQTEEVFSVGLVTGSGQIEIQTTKFEYLPGDPILILGDSGPNILVTLTLLDPDGDEVKIKETFTNKEGKISSSSFRVPSDAKPGIWIISAKSGPNFDKTEFTVLPTKQEGISVSITGIEPSPQGDLVHIVGYGAAQSQQVFIKIISSDDVLVGDLSIISTKSGGFSTFWLVPKDTIPGIYTLTSSDPFDSAETTFELELKS